MSKFLENLWSGISHNRWTVLAVVLVVAMAGVVIPGCIFEPQATSPLTGESVPETQFIADSTVAVDQAKELTHKAEVETLRVAEAINTGVEDIKEQQAKNEALWTILTGTVTSLSAAAPAPVGAILASLLGVGSLLLNVGQVADKRRADKLITQLKTPA